MCLWIRLCNETYIHTYAGCWRRLSVIPGTGMKLLMAGLSPQHAVGARCMSMVHDCDRGGRGVAECQAHDSVVVIYAQRVVADEQTQRQLQETIAITSSE